MCLLGCQWEDGGASGPTGSAATVTGGDRLNGRTLPAMAEIWVRLPSLHESLTAIVSERFFPAWAKERWPVRKTVIRIPTQVMRVCPHISIPNRQTHIDWMVRG